MGFSISEAAADEIQRRLQTSSVGRPIAMMIDCTDWLPRSAELDAALSRHANQAELRDIAKRAYPESKFPAHLDVGIYSKSQYPSWTFVTICGVEFVLPFWARLALRKWTLDYVERRFLLRSGDRVRLTLTGARRDAA